MIWSLTILLLAVPVVSAQQTRVVRFNSADGVTIGATYYPSPTTNSAPAVILLHSYGKNRQEWADFAGQLQSNRIAALALDLRGHGDSTRQISDGGVESLEWQTLLPRDFTAMALDVEAAYNWLADLPGINPRRIAIAGSSVSANVALRYTALNDEVAALLLLSPGLTFKGLRVDDVMARLRPLPLRIVVSVGDPYSYESSKRLIEIRQEIHPVTPSETELIECGGPLHGATMFLGIKKLAPALVDWLKQVLHPAP